MCVCAQLLSDIWLFVDLGILNHQALLFMEFSRQEYWSGLLFPIPGDLPIPDIKPASLLSLAIAGWFFATAPPRYLHSQTEMLFLLFREFIFQCIITAIIRFILPLKSFHKIYFILSTYSTWFICFHILQTFKIQCKAKYLQKKNNFQKCIDIKGIFKFIF